LDAIVARAMSKKREARYATWDEFAHDLAQAFRNKQLTEQAEDVPDSEKFETLRGLAFFKDFSDVEIWEVVRFSRWESIAADTVVMKDGEPGEYFCFLVEGEMKVSKRNRTLGLLMPGDVFGEMAVISRANRVRGANVATQTNCRIMSIKADALRHASDACRVHFYQGFLEVLSKRLAQSNARLATA
ncbi:MAG TPA: cyclic nucleotide-binding domain-containing protein, partial [Rhodocyclaceae bacterium]